MPDNKIQDIANKFTAYKPNTTLSLVKAVLEDLNAPFPEETKFYLKSYLAILVLLMVLV